MIPFDDQRWLTFLGGYGSPCQVADTIEDLYEVHISLDQFWEFAWNELHHQGDIGAASVAALSWITKYYVANGVVDGRLVAYLCCIIEPQRVHEVIPPDVKSDAAAAIEEALRYYSTLTGLDCEGTMQLQRAIALRNGHLQLAQLLDYMTPEDPKRILEKHIL